MSHRYETFKQNISKRDFSSHLRLPPRKPHPPLDSRHHRQHRTPHPLDIRETTYPACRMAIFNIFRVGYSLLASIRIT